MNLSLFLWLCAVVLCATAGALVWWHPQIALGLVVLGIALILAGAWCDHDTRHGRHLTRASAPPSERGPWRTRVLDRAARLRDSDVPVSHARTIERGGR